MIEKSGNSERAYDLYSRLLKDRIIFFTEELTNDVANSIVAQLLFLESVDSDRDIYIYINSPGGIITGMLAIFDTMQYIKNDVCTICIGQAASAASFILAAGTKGKRMSLPNARIMLHQPSGGAGGQVTDIMIHANEILSVKKKMNTIYAKLTGQPVEKIAKDLERDFFLSPEGAVEYGLIDTIEVTRPVEDS